MVDTAQGIKEQAAALQKREEQLLEDGAWFRRGLVRLRCAVDLRRTIDRFRTHAAVVA